MLLTSFLYINVVAFLTFAVRLPDFLAQNNVLTNRDSSWRKIYEVLAARCSPFVISKVLAAHVRKLFTARARKNIRIARMLANARKDHSIPLIFLL